MLESTTRYAAASREFMGEAYQYLADNDLPQASEKGWNAAENMVKAIAEERGWAHDTRRRLFPIVSDLGREAGNTEIIILFGLSHNLHLNYYENWFCREDVQLCLKWVQQLLDLLAPLLESER